jgi:hypothetical protein
MSWKTCMVFALLVSAAALASEGVGVTQAIRGKTAVTPLAAVVVGAQRVDWAPAVAYSEIVLTVVGPGDFQFHKSFASGELPTFELANDQTDGMYTYELRVTPPGQKRIRGAVTQAAGESAAAPTQPLVQSGFFTVRNGAVVQPGLPEPAVQVPPSTTAPSAAAQGTGAVTPNDIVEADDLIVQGSECIGLDCVNGEDFNGGFDTLKLKENNLRVFFDDDSTSAGFPANQWRFVINDSASGGGSYFALEDSTAADVPFRVEAGARANAIYAASSGRVGFGTATPVRSLHTLWRDTPAVRLEQDTSGGYTAQTWDVAGNEANFFIMDVTHGSVLPFRIFPGAPYNAFVLAASGNVGVGTASPSARLHVVQPSGNADLRFDGSASANFLLNRGNTSSFSRFQFLTAGGLKWSLGMINDGSHNFHLGPNISTTYFFVNQTNGRVGIGTTAPTHALDMGGGAYCTGTQWVSVSSRAAKQDIEDLSTEAAEDAVAKLNPVTFEYKVSPGEHHVGFIAEDVPDLVAMPDRKGLSTMDVVAVLTKVVQQQQSTIQKLEKRVAELERSK